MSDGPIAKQWQEADSDRSASLTLSDNCARLACPPLMSRRGRQADAMLAQNYQSMGSRGVSILAGKMVLGIYAPDRPWVRQEPHPAILNHPNPSSELAAAIHAMQQILFLRDLTIMGVLESAAGRSDRAVPQGFRSGKRISVLQSIVTGDSLERMNDDYTCTVFRREQYVVVRDSEMQIVWLGIREEKDPLDLTDEELSKASLARADLSSKPYKERKQDLYTLYQWQERTKRWHIAQEINGVEMNADDEPVSRFISTPYDLVPGDNYGHGKVEENYGDLASLDNLCEKRLETAAANAKHHPLIDENSDFMEDQFLRPSGTPLRCRMVGGEAQDIGFLKVDRPGDWAVLRESIHGIEKNLGPAMLIDSEMVRDSERTTLGEVNQVTLRELNGALGGVYAFLADKQQVPTIRRTIYQLKRDKLYPVAPRGMDEMVHTRMLTGMSALAREAQANALMGVADVAARLGPEATARIDAGVFLDTYMRFLPIHQPGLIKSREQVKAEIDESIRRQAQAKAIDVAGNVAQQTAINQSEQPINA